MAAREDLDDTVAALLVPLDGLDDLVLDEMFVLDEALLQETTAASPRGQPLRSVVPSEDDTSSGESSSSSSRPHEQARHTTKKKKVRSAAYDSNSARNKRRRELAYLRQRVAEMQTELARVQAEIYGATDAGADATPSVWRQIASRQFKDRQRAETENERLKLALETQLKVARSLESILTKRSTAKTMEECGFGHYLRAIDCVVDGSDASLFDSLLKTIDSIYTDAEWLVRQGPDHADDALTSTSDSRMRPTANGLLVEIYATDLLPFVLTDTSAAAWQYFSHGKNLVPDRYRHFYERVGENLGTTENTVLERSAFEMTSAGSRVAAKLTQALRRYVEPNRVVIVWNAVLEPTMFAGKPLDEGFSLREWGCMVLKPSSSTNGGSPLVVLQSCFFIAPEFRGDSDNKKDTADIGSLTECVMSWTEAGVLAWRQRIENILLDNHLGIGQKTSRGIESSEASGD